MLGENNFATTAAHEGKLDLNELFHCYFNGEASSSSKDFKLCFSNFHLCDLWCRSIWRK